MDEQLGVDKRHTDQVVVVLEIPHVDLPYQKKDVTPCRRELGGVSSFVKPR